MNPSLLLKISISGLLSCGTVPGANLLFFGNSFTIQNNVSGKVGLLAEAEGKTAPLIVADLAGGEDLAYHLGEINDRPNNNLTHSSLAGGNWDFVIIQGYSTEATSALGDPTAFRANARAIQEAVLNHSPAATVILFETWAREAGHAYYPGSFSNPATMQAEIRQNYGLAAQDLTPHGLVGVAPVGDAFELANFDSSLYASDRYHASPSGSLLASLVLYRTIYGEDVSDISYTNVSSWAGVNSATWSELVNLADTVPIPEPAPALMGLLGFAFSFRRKRS
ncbi:MAG: DUF4886 domain-containing protein [Verrucomicrobiales bacterium]